MAATQNNAVSPPAARKAFSTQHSETEPSTPAVSLRVKNGAGSHLAQWVPNSRITNIILSVYLIVMLLIAITGIVMFIRGELNLDLTRMTWVRAKAWLSDPLNIIILLVSVFAGPGGLAMCGSLGSDGDSGGDGGGGGD